MEFFSMLHDSLDGRGLGGEQIHVYVWLSPFSVHLKLTTLLIGYACMHTKSLQFSSVAQSCPTLCDPMNCSTPGFPVHLQLLEFTQTHVHWISDAIQPSHPLLSPSPPAPNPSQHQGLFKWVFPSIRLFSSESVFHIRWPKYWSFSFSISSSNEYLGLISFRISLQSKGLSRVSSNTTVQKHQFFGAQLSSQSNFRIHTWPLEKP